MKKSISNMIEELSWDSIFFEVHIGKIENANQYNLDEILISKKENNYDRLYLFSPTKLLAVHKDLFLADKKITFHKKINSDIKPTKCIKIYNGGITPQLLKLCLLSGHKSRFKTDSYFAYKFEELYTLWLVNSLNKQFADEVLIYEQNNDILGFVSLKKDTKTGQIGLIAVSENMHGKGIGRELLQAAENWFIENGLFLCEVVTQASNNQACNFYNGFGYSVIKTEYIYHL